MSTVSLSVLSGDEVVFKKEFQTDRRSLRVASKVCQYSSNPIFFANSSTFLCHKLCTTFLLSSIALNIQKSGANNI